jgi:tripartite-type tricarboxylate transporter receptor subunit TctC
MKRALLALVVLVLGVPVVASAQTYPSKPIRFIVPAPPGGASDILARIIGQKLNERWGQPVIIDSKPGASGVVGGEITAKADPDGYTILMISGLHTSTPSTLGKLPYDPIKDFEPVIRVAASPLILVVNPETSVKSVQDLVTYAKSQGGKAAFGSAGAGSPSHLSGEVFSRMAKLDPTHVPYKGAGQSTNDLLGNHVMFIFNNPLSTIPLVESGKLRALAVTGSRRMSVLPDLPTMIEAGFPDFEVVAWWGVLAPAKTPPEIVAKLNTTIKEVLNSKQVEEQFAKNGVYATPDTPQEFSTFMRDDIALWAKITKEGGVRPE